MFSMYALDVTFLPTVLVSRWTDLVAGADTVASMGRVINQSHGHGRGDYLIDRASDAQRRSRNTVQ